MLLAACGRPSSDGTRPGPPGSGAWVDEIVFQEEADIAKVVEMLEAGALDAYAAGRNDPEIYRRVRTSETLDHVVSYGTNYELTLNPAGPVLADGSLNPFAVPRIREALNRLVDRRHVAEEIFGGLAVPRLLPLVTAFPDHARLADVARQLEMEYAHDTSAAALEIAREMERLGARRVGGRWTFRGRPVRLVFLIRSDDRRREVGDYVATLLEDLGFEVERAYKTAAEVSPIWIGGDPREGRWHLYTGAWISLVVRRDEADNFDYYYTPRGRPEPLWQAYRPDPRFDRIADRLGRNDYASFEERMDLMREAVRLALQDSARVWLADGLNVWPRRREVTAAADLAGGFAGSHLLPYTLRFEGRAGGTVRFAAPSILTEPWNPVAGSNWLFDQTIIRTTRDPTALPDPYTGLYHPQRIESATVEVLEGLPVKRTLSWVDLRFVPRITVPPDAWIDWDAAAESFVTVGARFPRGLSARTRTVIRYDTGLFRRWHDGTTATLADLIASFALLFDRASPKSPLFDEAAVPAFESFRKTFRGLRILSADPPEVEIYSDHLFADAEEIAAHRAGYLEAAAPWHALAVGILAERAGDLAFSADKADRRKVERMNYVAGPSLAVLDRHLERAADEAFVPYANVVGPHVAEGEARARYEALRAWRRARGHFWVGNGPFYLEAVRPVEKIVTVRKYDGFTDPPEKWLRFAEPRIPDVDIAGPRTVAPGAPAPFDVAVTFRGAPYPPEEIEGVRYLLFDARGRLIRRGEAAASGAAWRIALGPEETRRLGEGSNRLDVVVTSRSVALPVFRTHVFVTAH